MPSAIGLGAQLHSTAEAASQLTLPSHVAVPKVLVVGANFPDVRLALLNQFLRRHPVKPQASTFRMTKILIIRRVAEHAGGHDKVVVVTYNPIIVVLTQQASQNQLSRELICLTQDAEASYDNTKGAHSPIFDKPDSEI